MAISTDEKAYIESERVSPTAIISKFSEIAFVDTNNNGYADEGENGIRNTVATLLDGDGNPVLNTTGKYIITNTDSNGAYHFLINTFGDYKVSFTTPTGYIAANTSPESDTTSTNRNNLICEQIYTNSITLGLLSTSAILNGGYIEILGNIT